MKQAILLHGSGGSGDDYFWFADTKKYLEANGYAVWWKQLPNTEQPSLYESLEFLTDENIVLNTNTIIIAHSSACPLALAWIQSQNLSVKQLVLVSGYYEAIEETGVSGRMIPEEFKWEELKSKIGQITMINSNNDPWGCTDIQAREPAINLGATLIVPTGEGHMGSESFSQPYNKFSLLKKVLEI